MGISTTWLIFVPVFLLASIEMLVRREFSPHWFVRRWFIRLGMRHAADRHRNLAMEESADMYSRGDYDRYLKS
jgi:hypothetical protein